MHTCYLYDFFRGRSVLPTPILFGTTLQLPLSNQRCHKQRVFLASVDKVNKVPVLVMGVLGDTPVCELSFKTCFLTFLYSLE